MGALEKIADLKYCYQVLDCIKDLEKVFYKRELLIKELHERVTQEVDHLAFWSAWIMPILSLLALAFFSFKNIGSMQLWDIIVGILATVSISCFLYALMYFGVKISWEKGFMGKRKSKLYLKWAKRLENDKILINRNFEKILENDVLKNPRIDLCYYSSNSFEQFIHCLEMDKAGFLSEAVYISEKNKELIARRTIVDEVKKQLDKDFLLESIKN